MRDIPILFSAPMVRALLDGSKTQTRRVLKQATGPSLSVDIDDETPGVAELSWLHGDGPGYEVNETIKRVSCPYGVPGDHLWVRETWAQNEDQLSDTRMDRSFVYRADGEKRALDNGTEKPWRPSIFMPRWASRITLEVTDVRVERLAYISDEDCIAEGIEKAGPHGYGWRKYTDPAVVCTTPRQSYGSLWESINGPGSLDLNPWVWVVSFRRV